MHKNEITTKLFETIPEEVFLDPDEASLTDNPAKHIKLGILSTTTNVLINRNNSPTGVTSHILADKPRVMVPAQKWKGCEQSNTVKLAREMNLLPDSYQQNLISSTSGLLNPVSVIFGDSVTAGDQPGQVRARINYDWAYSYEPVAAVTKRLQHNTLEEDGTIRKGEDRVTPAAEALHRVQYVMPGTAFIRFVSLENITPELFLFYIAGLLSTHSYGARKKIVGDNIENQIVAISWGSSEQPVSSYSVLQEYWPTGQKEIDHREAIENAMAEAYGDERTITGDDIEPLIQQARHLLANLDDLEGLLSSLQAWIEESWHFFKED